MIAQQSAMIRKRLGVRLREIRKYLRGEADKAPTQETVCVWIELAHILECYQDVVDLAAHIYEAEVDPFLYKRVQRLTRLAKVKVNAANGGATDAG